MIRVLLACYPPSFRERYGGRALVVVSHYVTAFLDHVLRGATAPAPDHRYPEARPAA